MSFNMAEWARRESEEGGNWVWKEENICEEFTMADKWKKLISFYKWSIANQASKVAALIVKTGVSIRESIWWMTNEKNLDIFRVYVQVQERLDMRGFTMFRTNSKSLFLKKFFINELSDRQSFFNPNY